MTRKAVVFLWSSLTIFVDWAGPCACWNRGKCWPIQTPQDWGRTRKQSSCALAFNALSMVYKTILWEWLTKRVSLGTHKTLKKKHEQKDPWSLMVSLWTYSPHSQRRERSDLQGHTKKSPEASDLGMCDSDSLALANQSQDIENWALFIFRTTENLQSRCQKTQRGTRFPPLRFFRGAIRTCDALMLLTS